MTTDPDAEFAKALRYEQGDGLAQNVRLAAKHYRAAAECGHVAAQLAMAKFCLIGKGISRDLEEAANWYLQAAEQGNVVAQYNLGQMFLHGTGVNKDESMAATWLIKAASGGHPDAATILRSIVGQSD